MNIELTKTELISVINGLIAFRNLRGNPPPSDLEITLRKLYENVACEVS